MPRPAARRRFLTNAVAIVLVASSLGLPDIGRAKEHNAACEAMPLMLGRVRASLLLASIQRARGSSLAAYRVLRTNAELLLSERLLSACGAIPLIFRRSLDRSATAASAMEASLLLDIGYAAVLSIAMTGQMPTDDIQVKALQIPESVRHSDGCPDLFALTRRLEGPSAGLATRAQGVLADVKRDARCSGLRQVLEGSGSDKLAEAVDLVLLDESDVTPVTPIARCPELPMVLDRLASAVSAGAPLFNQGNHEACRRIYDLTARALAGPALPVGHCPVVRTQLEASLKEAAAAPSASEAAWALRKGFDRIAGALSDVEPTQDLRL